MARQGPRARVAPGIYKDASGYAATVSVGSGKAKLSREKRYPSTTALKVMKAWQDETRVQLRKRAGDVQPGTLAEDVPVYLAQVAETLASIKDRTRDVKAWLSRFGQRRRSSLQTRELDAQLRAWRNTDGLSASTVNHRRDALSDLFATLDQGGHNPVKGCVWFARPAPVPQAIPRARILAVLNGLEDHGKTKWRLLLMHWTGMRPSQMARLTRESFVLDGREPPGVYVPSGKGGKPSWIPLTSEGQQVAAEFIARKAFGSWSCPSANKAIAASAARLNVPAFNLYKIRHSFATALRAQGADLADVQALLGHTTSKTTLIYAPTVNPRLIDAVGRLAGYDRAVDSAGKLAPEDGTGRET